MYNKKQKNLLDKLEMALIELVHAEELVLAQALAPIVELLQQENSVCAVLESEELGLDPRIIKELRTVFDVRI